jgi:hypothetical protein
MALEPSIKMVMVPVADRKTTGKRPVSTQDAGGTPAFPDNTLLLCKLVALTAGMGQMTILT